PRTNADEVLGRLFLFHHFMTRQSNYYANLVARHPAMLNLYFNIEEELRNEDWPDFLDGWGAVVHDLRSAVLPQPDLRVLVLPVLQRPPVVRGGGRDGGRAGTQLVQRYCGRQRHHHGRGEPDGRAGRHQRPGHLRIPPRDQYADDPIQLGEGTRDYRGRPHTGRQPGTPVQLQPAGAPEWVAPRDGRDPGH